MSTRCIRCGKRLEPTQIMARKTVCAACSKGK